MGAFLGELFANIFVGFVTGIIKGFANLIFDDKGVGTKGISLGDIEGSVRVEGGALYAEIDVDMLGLSIETPELGLPVEYGDVFEGVVEDFIGFATDVAPVDSGALVDSIGGEADNEGCSVWCEVEYAACVEYGTWKMGAQPFFEKALKHAFAMHRHDFNDIWQEAMEEERLILKEVDD